MTREFIPYEQALELKELGFDDNCLCRYCIVTKWEEPTGEILLQLSDCKLSERNLVKAPLYQQAFRWFREKHDLCHHIHVNVYEYEWYIEHRIEDIEYEKYDYQTYEEAELACLKKLIQILKTNKL